jgi:hypothetical protein
MKLLLKFPLLALILLFITEAVLPGRAIAGSEPVVIPDAATTTLGDTLLEQTLFPGLEQTVDVSAQIGGAVANTVQTLQSNEEVPSINGRTLSISSEKLDVIAAAISNAGFDIEILEEQLSEEMDLEIELSVLGTSSDELEEAIKAVNELIVGLDREHLITAVESPTFMALLKMLGNANQAVTGDSDEFLVEGSAIGIVKITLR